jgi:filamin
MAWIQSVLPEIRLTNFRQNWNDGIALSCLIDYCKPGTFSNWADLDPTKKYENCTNALRIAEEELGIPDIITPENMASNELDELSCMTYLSYFIRKNGPGYIALLANIQKV